MKVKLLKRWATPDRNHAEGQEVEVDDAEARALAADGAIEPIPGEASRKAPKTRAPRPPRTPPEPDGNPTPNPSGDAPGDPTEAPTEAE